MGALAIPYPVAMAIGIIAVIGCLACAVPLFRAERAERIRERDKQYAREAALGKADAKQKIRATGLQRTLDDAGLDMQADKAVLLVVVAAVACALVLSLLMGPAGFAIGALCVPVAAWLIVRGKRNKRMGAFEYQLGAALPMIAEGMRGGMSFEQSVKNATNYMDDPIREQFRRLAVERQYGVALDEAVENIAERTGSSDMTLLTAVVAVNQQTGGNMSSILDSVSETIQSRARLRKHVASVTAMGRFSAIIIACIPLAVFGILMVLNRDYMILLIQDWRGWLCIAVSLVLIAIGMLIIRKLYDIKIY